jgi:hypothetical protein
MYSYFSKSWPNKLLVASLKAALCFRYHALDDSFRGYDILQSDEVTKNRYYHVEVEPTVMTALARPINQRRAAILYMTRSVVGIDFQVNCCQQLTSFRGDLQHLGQQG